MVQIPVSALIGGGLIGASAVLLLLFNGRIAGISGILNAALNPRETEGGWRLLCLAGLILGAGTYVWIRPDANPTQVSMPLWLLGIAGFLVGFGTRMGSGCTSGHGVCGLGRFSFRSLVATLVFMAAGIATVFVMRHMAGAL